MKLRVSVRGLARIWLGVLMEFHLRAPEILKNWNSGIPPRDDLLEIWPECRRLRRPRELDAEAETARKTENLGAWGGESGRSRRSAPGV